MKGEYYVFCTLCSCKVFNTEARRDSEGMWQCRGHVENKVHSSHTVRPHDNMFIPKIVRAPNTYSFANAADIYWDTAQNIWETEDCTWDEI